MHLEAVRGFRGPVPFAYAPIRVRGAVCSIRFFLGIRHVEGYVYAFGTGAEYVCRLPLPHPEEAEAALPARFDRWLPCYTAGQALYLFRAVAGNFHLDIL